MAQPTNIKKYTIDGKELAVYPLKCIVEPKPILRLWNNMYGQFVYQLINIKWKIKWVFDVVSKKDIISMFGPILDNIDNLSMTFTITAPMPGRDSYYSYTCYLGSEILFESVDLITTNGDANYYKFELHFIEIDGKVLV